MITILIEKYRIVLVATMLLSLLGTYLFLQYAEITFDLPILLPFFLFATALLYSFCFSWPYFGAAIIEMNRQLIGSSWPKPQSLAKFLLWFAIVGALIAILGVLSGDVESALGISGSLGLLAGTCCYLGRGIEAANKSAHENH